MLEPITNPMWVFIVLGESPSGYALLGGAVVLAAIAGRTIVAEPRPLGPLPAPD
jgi:hypothetical protein